MASKTKPSTAALTLDLIAASAPALILVSAITYTAWCNWWI